MVGPRKKEGVGQGVEQGLQSGARARWRSVPMCVWLTGRGQPVKSPMHERTECGPGRGVDGTQAH